MTHSTLDGHGRSGRNKRTNVWKKITGPRRRRMFLEQLEERSLLAQMVWDGDTSGDWTIATNWQGDIAPRAGDDLVFTSQGVDPTVNNFAAGTEFNTITIRDVNSVTPTGGLVLTGNAINLRGGLTALGIPCFACTPQRLPELLEGALRGADLNALATKVTQASAGK